METPKILGGMRVPLAMVDALKPFKKHSEALAKKYDDGIGIPRVAFPLAKSEETNDGRNFKHGLSTMEPFDIFRISDNEKTLVLDTKDGTIMAIWGFKDTEIFKFLDGFQEVIRKCVDKYLKP
jgi:hypothetical protein